MRRYLVILLVACAAWPQASREERLARHRNLGKAFFENPTTHPQAVAEFKQALDLEPKSARDRFNYAAALIANGQTKDAITELERVQSQNGSIPNPWFVLGVLYKKAGEYDKASKQFEKFAQLVPDEPTGHYNLATLYKLAGRMPEAIKAFENASRLDPALAAPHFQLYNAYRQAGRREDAARELKAFQKAKEDAANAVIAEDMEWNFYSEVMDETDAAAVADSAKPAPVRLVGRRLAAGAAGDAGLLVFDANGDLRPDVGAWAGGRLRVFRSALGAGATVAQGVHFAAAGDYNNDGRMDLVALTAAGPALYESGPTRFAAKALPVKGKFDVALWLDYDHDYDLDLLLFGEKNTVLRNQGETGFEERAGDFPFATGKATGAVAFRVVADTKGSDVVVSYADRPAALYQDRLAGKFEQRAFAAIPQGAKVTTAIDADHSGSMDIVFEHDGKGGILYNKGAFNDARSLRFQGAARPGWKAPLAVADFGNRGVFDVLAGGELHRQASPGNYAKPEIVGGALFGNAYATADFNGDGKVDAAVLDEHNALHILTNQTPTSNTFLRVTLEGVKNPKLAAGAEVEVKAGVRYAKQVYQGFPLVFGLRDAKTADAVRITWQNGLIQSEAQQPVARLASYQEAQRLTGSCPQVFTWNGSGFEYITDVLGVAPLGASSGDGEYFPVDHLEHIQIPASALAPKDGYYEIRLSEELAEVAYVDQVKLIAVDHPAGHRLVLNEKFQGPPFPDLKIWAVRESHAPERVRRRGRTVEVEWGPSAVALRNPLLILRGWVDWADGSQFRQRSQEKGNELTLPSLEYAEGGTWRRVLEDLGMPAGKPKTIGVELDRGAARMRIPTNVAVHWDEIRMGEAADVEMRRTELAAIGSFLRFRGFSRVTLDPARESPETFRYEAPGASSMWNPTIGKYTRYGPVDELMKAADDRFAIMGSGDELALRFEAAGLPPLPAGWTRGFVLAVDGWAKDSDPNTAFSQSVEPLPFHGMSRYPYGAGERFPDDEVHRRWREEYNTRPALRLTRPLWSRSRAGN
ncbi:MAG: tetratricopeptide repeat protein [Bryobacteraceae bacterium]